MHRHTYKQTQSFFSLNSIHFPFEHQQLKIININSRPYKLLCCWCFRFGSLLFSSMCCCFHVLLLLFFILHSSFLLLDPWFLSLSSQHKVQTFRCFYWNVGQICETFNYFLFSFILIEIFNLLFLENHCLQLFLDSHHLLLLLVYCFFWE